MTQSATAMSELKDLRRRARALGKHLRKQRDGTYLLADSDGTGTGGSLDFIPTLLDAYEGKRWVELGPFVIGPETQGAS